MDKVVHKSEYYGPDTEKDGLSASVLSRNLLLHREEHEKKLPSKLLNLRWQKIRDSANRKSKGLESRSRESPTKSSDLALPRQHQVGLEIQEIYSRQSFKLIILYGLN